MDTGATAIFIMEGTPVANKRIATKPLTINLPDARLHFPAGILRIPVIPVPVACFSQESRFLFLRNLVFRGKYVDRKNSCMGPTYVGR
jgi:hypothetical protein